MQSLERAIAAKQGPLATCQRKIQQRKQRPSIELVADDVEAQLYHEAQNLVEDINKLEGHLARYKQTIPVNIFLTGALIREKICLVFKFYLESYFNYSEWASYLCNQYILVYTVRIPYIQISYIQSPKLNGTGDQLII